jgi:tetratricopeptide (TPR) repeat protein
MKFDFSSFTLVRLAGQLVVGVVLVGCSILPTIPQDLQKTVQTQSAVELKKVPFFAQEEFYCGPSTLAMVLNYAGENTLPDKLVDLVYLPGRQGSLQIEMLAVPRRLGYLSYQISPNLPALFNALNTGSPVVVLLNLSLPIAAKWHYAVVVGYSPNDRSIILRSGSQERELIPLATFLKLWERSENWAFTVIDPNKKPPAYTEAHNYLKSIVALERSSLQKAAIAYQQGVKNWPKEPSFYFALGNLAYESQSYGDAEKSYRKAVSLNPNMGDAWNNLAEALIKLNRKSEARFAIKKAIEIGGSRLEVYKETSRKLQNN